MNYEIVTDTGANAPVLLLNNNIVVTHFESETRQMFETIEGSFIYFKDESKLHKVTLDTYNKALIKVTVFVDYKVQEQQNKSSI